MAKRTRRRRISNRWWVLMTQLPTHPAYLRVKLSRRIQRLGAVAIKNSVFVLPYNEQAQEDFQWLLREIREDGGEASLLESQLSDGLTDSEVKSLFVEARSADYRELISDLRGLLSEARGDLAEPDRKRLEAELPRLRSRLEQLATIEFFPTGRRSEAQDLLSKFERRLKDREVKDGVVLSPAEFTRRTWVTRKGIKIDRIASAWLIRRFIDPEAKFKFVSADGYKPRKGEVRFDMFEAEFTHEGDDCTFETLIARLRLSDDALRPIAEIIHDIDIKDAKFSRPEASGVATLIDGIVASTGSDTERLSRASHILDNLYSAFGDMKPGRR